MARRPKKTPIPARHATRLIEAARTGTAGALGQLLNAYRPFLLAVATEEFDSDLKAKAGPSDLVQETFVDAQRNFGSFKSDSDSELRIWLHAILMNRLADLRKRYLRTAKRQVRRERPLAVTESKEFLRELMDRDGQSPSSLAISREDAARIERALEGLTPAYRQVIVMRNQERRSFADIGQLIDRSPDAVRMLWKRAILRLRRDLGVRDG